jgi:hypothetical protein
MSRTVSKALASRCHRLRRCRSADDQRRSAGSYAALAALAFHDVFRAGASYYGIADLERLARDTYKFESHYIDRLVGPYPRDRQTSIRNFVIDQTPLLDFLG